MQPHLSPDHCTGALLQNGLQMPVALCLLSSSLGLRPCRLESAVARCQLLSEIRGLCLQIRQTHTVPLLPVLQLAVTHTVPAWLAALLLIVHYHIISESCARL